MNDNKAVSPLTQTLAAYIAEALRKPVPDAVGEGAKLHLVDFWRLESNAGLSALRAVRTEYETEHED